jgi:hypothetical protein
MGCSPLNEQRRRRAEEWPWSVMNGTRYPAPTNHCPPGARRAQIAMAAFKLTPVSSDLAPRSNTRRRTIPVSGGSTMHWLAFKTDVSDKELKHHYPWSGDPVKWEDVHAQALANPFQGEFNANAARSSRTPGIQLPTHVYRAGSVDSGGCTNTGNIRASTYLYPGNARSPTLASGNVNALRECSLNFELTTNRVRGPVAEILVVRRFNGYGFFNKPVRPDVLRVRGVPGMQLPTSFSARIPPPHSLSYYEQVHNASIFSLYMPIANVADTKNAFGGRNYSETEFYHTLLMSNHMEAEPEQFYGRHPGQGVVAQRVPGHSTCIS